MTDPRIFPYPVAAVGGRSGMMRKITRIEVRDTLVDLVHYKYWRTDMIRYAKEPMHEWVRWCRYNKAVVKDWGNAP